VTALRLVAAVVVTVLAGGQAARPGDWFDVGGHKLYLWCEGTGAPAVVLDGGTGGWSIHWEVVRRELVRSSRVCVYDRAGYGASEPGPAPRTARRASEELFYLLEAAGEKGPFLLVGHSFGGWVTRTFAAEHGDLVTGLVLIESAHEDQWNALPGVRAMLEEGAKANRILADRARAGTIDPATIAVEGVPDALAPALVEAMRRPGTYEAIAAELSAAVESAREVAALRRLGNLPLVVVSAGRSFDWFIERTPATAGMLDQLNARWMGLQRELTALSSDSRHIVSDEGVHALVRTDPALVVRVVRSAAKKTPGVV
jgi:pimeloyl-ACP methyl ester carboxylesterase